jgi:hypothetical protein
LPPVWPPERISVSGIGLDMGNIAENIPRTLSLKFLKCSSSVRFPNHGRAAMSQHFPPHLSPALLLQEFAAFGGLMAGLVGLTILGIGFGLS